MNFLNIFEERVSAIFEATPQGYTAPFSFKKLAKHASREMEDETFLINGANTAPGLYTILVSSEDDAVMRPLYANLTEEISQFIEGQANKKGYVFVGKPLVRFMVDPSLKSGKFSVFAENVDARTLMRLREEESAFIGGIAHVGGAPIAEAPQASVSQGASQADRRKAVRSRPRMATPLATPASAISPDDSSMQGLDVMPVSSDLDLSASAAPVPIMQEPFPEAKRIPPQMPASAAHVAAPAAHRVSSQAAAAAPMAAAAAEEPKTMLRPQVAATPLVNAHQAAPVAAPAPAAPAQASCTLIDTQSGRTYTAYAPECPIGRERNSGGIVLRDPNVSRHHARLTYDGTTWHITDLNSTNGTLVNDMDVQTCALHTGDVITIGLVNLTFREG